MEMSMTRKDPRPDNTGWTALLLFVLALWPGSPTLAADEPDLIFRRSTVFKWVSPNDKLATYGIDDRRSKGWPVISRCQRRAASRVGWACRTGLGYFSGMPPDRSDTFQVQAGTGRRHVPAAAFAVLQEDANRSRLRRQTERSGLCGIFGQTN